VPSRAERISLLAGILIAAAALGIAPSDRADWAAELIAPALMVLACVVGHRWLVFSRLAYWMIFLHVLVQLWGGHFTYGKEPFFGWLEARFDGLDRNHYDRLAHFALGFLLYVPVREIVVRVARVSRGWACFFAVAVIGAVAGLWEVFEWAVVAVNPHLDAAYLGHQDDKWDAQKDIVLAFVGALAAWPLFTLWHNARLKSLATEPAGESAE